MKRSEATSRFKKQRGHYFHAVIDSPYSKKYGISEESVHTIRTYAIFKKMKQKEIVFYIIDNINKGLYDQKHHFKEVRQEILSFLLRCKPEDFEEIIHKTKFDYED